MSLAGLATARQWVAWREEDRNGKPTKVPYDPATGRMARADDPQTWASRRKAEERAAPLTASECKGGIGLQLGRLATDHATRLGGVDLDSCLDPATGTLEPWAAEIVSRFASYAEVSPSGRGVKVFFTYADADLPALQVAMGDTSEGKPRHGRSWSRGSHCEIALHLSNRYFAVTGDHLTVAPADLQPVSLADLRWLIETAGPAFKGAGEAKPKGADNTRSGRALRLAGEMRRQGLDRAAFDVALAEDPELAEWAKDSRQVSRAWERTAPAAFDAEAKFDDIPDESIDGFAMTEDGVALAFALRHRDSLRFCHSTGRWFVWTGTYWRREETALAFSWAREICRERASTDPMAVQAKALAKAASAAAVERFARSDRAFAVTAEEWDRDPWLLGTPGGTVDLRTGVLGPAEPSDAITKLTAAAPIPLDQFDPTRDCPKWLAFLDQATGGDADAIRFLRQWAGYCLTGDTREEALLFVHGPGGSGKSTAINTLGDLMGDYAVNVATETLTAAKYDRHPTEIARLKGARMARASETEQGRAWAQQRITALTGGDTVTARFMRQDDFEFRPQFKLTIVGNHRPSIQNVDEAIRRRFNVMPFDHKPARVDHGLKDALRAEFAGILSWAILGCIDWQAEGLTRPRVVAEATAAYFDEQDVFAAWLDECCQIDKLQADSGANLWESWSMFARRAGEDPGTKIKSFPDRLKLSGFMPIKDTAGIRGRGFRGLRVIDAFDEVPSDEPAQ